MQGKTQAERLKKLMQQYHSGLTYTLALSPFEVKKSTLKKLKIGDIFSVGHSLHELILLKDKEIYAKALLILDDKIKKLQIIELTNEKLQKSSKKMRVVTCSFGILQSKKFKVGDILETADIIFDRFNIEIKGKYIAQGSLVKIDEEIAVQIDEVNV